jgi:hypothetical protein
MKKISAKINKIQVEMIVIERGDNASAIRSELKAEYKNVNMVSVGDGEDYEDWSDFSYALPQNAAALEAVGIKSDNLFYFECFNN